MNYTVTAGNVTIVDGSLGDTIAEGLVPQLENLVQEIGGFENSERQSKDRGNTKTTLAFTVTRTRSTAFESQEYLLNIAEKFPGNFDVEFQFSENSFTGKWFLKGAHCTPTPLEYNGQTNVVRWLIVGGKITQR